MKQTNENFLYQNLKGYYSGDRTRVIDRCYLPLSQVLGLIPAFRGDKELVLKPLNILLAKNVNQICIDEFELALKSKIINIVPASLLLSENVYANYPIRKLIKQYTKKTHVPVHLEFNNIELGIYLK